MVQRQQAFATGGAQHHLVAAVGLHAVHVLCREVEKQVNLATLEGCSQVVAAINEAKFHALDAGRIRAALALHLGQGDGAGAALQQAVRPGAHRVGSNASYAVGMHDDRRGLAQAKQQVRVGVVQRQHHGVGVGRGNVSQVVKQRLARLVGRGRGARTLKAKAHRLRVQRRTVVKTHPLVQREGVAALAFIHGPRLRQQRRDAAVFLNAREPFQNVVVNHLAHRGRGGCGGVQALWLQAQIDDDLALARAAVQLGQGFAGTQRTARQGSPLPQTGAARRRKRRHGGQPVSWQKG